MVPRRFRYIFYCAVTLYAAPAFAYLDPGTGSLLIQGLIASVAAAGALAKLYWHKIVGLFRGDRQSKEAPAPDDVEDHIS
jgi:hypothetical protein